MDPENGVLYIVATPLGNLGDISLRAIEILKQVDRIAAEDTRHSAKLLAHYGITTSTLSLHEHNERDRIAVLLDKLAAGETIALISDAGTPLISDPGYHLVKAARHAGMKVIPIPGASAVISALSVSGLRTDRFVFEGFLPSKQSARRQQLQALVEESRTIVFYEAPHRLVDTLQDMQEVFGAEREVCLAREMTKTYETITSQSLGVLLEWVKQDANQQKGECVILVAGNDQTRETATHEISLRELLQVLLAELPLKQAVKLAVAITGEKKNPVYDLALEISQKGKKP